MYRETLPFPHPPIKRSDVPEPSNDNGIEQAQENERSKREARRLIRNLLTEETIRAVRSFLSKMAAGDNAEIVNDIVNTTVVKAMEHADQFIPGTNFLSWLITIARNTYITDYRQGTIRRKYFDIDSDALDLKQGNERMGAEELAALVEESELIREAFNGIPQIFRDVFMDCYLGDLTYKELAEKYKVDEGTIMSRLYRAREKVMKILTEMHPELIPASASKNRSPRKKAQFRS